MAIYEKALAAIRREQMLPIGASVTVGLSGGADSVALLHLLLSLREEFSLGAVTAVHINHCLRGEESLRDQHFAESLCREWQVPLTVYTCDVATLAEENHSGVEEAGRTVRYEQFEKEADRIGGYIATAHTASDNAETVLLHVCRGSGLHGLTGIPPVRGRVIRPLLDCTRAEVEDYCAQHGLSYVTDSTNTDQAYARNRIRHGVLPQLREINPQAEEALLRLVGYAREWDSHLSAHVDEALVAAKAGENTYRRDVLLALEPVVKSAVFHRLLREHGRQRGSECHIREAMTVLENGGRLSLPGNRQMTVSGERVRFDSTESIAPFRFEQVFPPKTVTVNGKTWQLVCSSCEKYEQKQNNSKILFANACDCDKIVGSLILRQRLPGDTYHPAGRGCGKTLKKLFNEAALAEWERDSLPILCDEQGILLVPGFCCDERVRVTAETKRLLILKMTEDV